MPERGAFHFCSACPAGKNCCSKVGHDGRIAPPFLLDKEATLIAKATKIPDSEFANFTDVSAQTGSVKERDGRCYFLNPRDGRCNIYAVRPFDCRLFPFDIMRMQDDRLHWIMYQDLCPTEFDIEHLRLQYFEAAKGIFRDTNISANELKSFALQSSDKMKKNKFVILEEVKI